MFVKYVGRPYQQQLLCRVILKEFMNNQNSNVINAYIIPLDSKTLQFL